MSAKTKAKRKPRPRSREPSTLAPGVKISGFQEFKVNKN